MFDEEQGGLRVGVWLIVVAAVAGLFMLLQPRAHAAELNDLDGTALRLSERTAPSADEQLAAAEELLREERMRKTRKLASIVLEEGADLLTGLDPRDAVRAGWRLARTLWDWPKRSQAEDQALDLLEYEVARGASAPELKGLYAELRQREVDARATELLRSARAALDDGQGAFARVRLRRALEFRPGDERAQELLDRLAEPLPITAIESENLWTSAEWEVPAAAALLSGDYSQAASLAASEPSHPRGELTHAAASYLDGDRKTARALLLPLRGRADAIGRAAGDWMERPDLSAGHRFESERRRYYLRKGLGLLGGDPLAQEGLQRSRSGYDAWRRSFAPLNLALSVPARLVRGWSPDGSALKAAAHAYLEFEPDGLEAESASNWVAQLTAEPQSEGEGASAWRGSRLVLPKPRTDFMPLAPRPLVLTRAALSAAAERGLLGEIIGDAEAVLLRTEQDAVPAPTLDSDDSLELLAELASALESGELHPLRGGQARSIERVQRLELAVRSGMRLVATPYGVESARLRDVLPNVMLEGGTDYADATRVRRGADKLRFDRALGAAGFTCPRAVLCVHRPSAVSADVYGALDTDADMLFGASASFQHATVALEVEATGAQARLTMPLARWLGIDRWVPLAAQVAVGTEGVYVGPVASPSTR